MHWRFITGLEIPAQHGLADRHFCTRIGKEVAVYGSDKFSMGLPFLALDPSPRPAIAPGTPDPTAPGLLLFNDEPLAISSVDCSSPYRTSIKFDKAVTATVWSWQSTVEIHALDPDALSVKHGGLRHGYTCLYWVAPCTQEWWEGCLDHLLPSGPSTPDSETWVDIVGHPGHQLRALAVAKRPNGEPNPPEYLRWPRPGASFGPDAYDLRVSLERRVR